MTIYTESEVRDLLTRDEGQFLELKSLWDRQDGKMCQLERRAVRNKIAEYVAAFANADGGLLILGVEDDGEPSGHGYPEEAVQDFLAVPERRLRPSVRVRTQRIPIDGHELILLNVPMAAEAVMVEGNGFPYRVGDQAILEPQKVINARKQAYRRIGYEQMVRQDATIKDIDLDLARRFLANSPLKDRPIEDILASYGLIGVEGGDAAITNAALLLFGKPPFSRWHPRAGVRFFRIQGTERKVGKDRNVSQLPRLEPPLATMIEESYRATAAQIRKSEKLHDLFFREMPEYPTLAWQEALVNAIAHRDYNDQGREVEVSFFDDRMEIESPGELPPPVTIEALLRRERIHASRNPLIVRVLADAAIMREEGEGVPRMFEEMEESLLSPPQFETAHSAFKVRFLNEPVFDSATIEWKALVDRMELTTNQKRTLLAYPDGFSNEDYRSLSDIDRDQAYKEINEMVSKGILLRPESAGRGAFYRVAADIKKTRTWLSERTGVLMDYFHDHPFLKNADYQRVFNVTRVKALRELQRLVEAGLVEREGERKATVYRPGSGLRSSDKK